MTKVKGRIFKVDGEGELLGIKVEREATAICIIDNGKNGRLLKVENSETNLFENWQLGIDDIEVVDYDQSCLESETLCKEIQKAQTAISN